MFMSSCGHTPTAERMHPRLGNARIRSRRPALTFTPCARAVIELGLKRALLWEDETLRAVHTGVEPGEPGSEERLVAEQEVLRMVMANLEVGEHSALSRTLSD